MKQLSLYIHIPFCEQKCPYCDFYSLCNKSEYDRYSNKLLEAIKMYSQKYQREIVSVYFGGGTPSVLGTLRLCGILEAIKKCFSVSCDAEITVEINPCSAVSLDFKVLKSYGFNRISIGLQSANEHELKILNRRHTLDDVKKTIKNARIAGIKNISLDLMLCVPEQTKSSLTESIKFCKDCDVEHISTYLLKFEENTPFYKNRAQLDTFDDDAQALMYEHTIKELKKYGYHQYEISNFCKKGYEGKHNLRYWLDEEYLGIGPSAHSFIDGKRFYYDRSLDAFYKDITIDDGDGGSMDEYIMLNLRLKEGLDLKILKTKYNPNLSQNFFERLNKLKNKELINYEDDIVSLTTKGFLVSNSVIGYILETF